MGNLILQNDLESNFTGNNSKDKENEYNPKQIILYNNLKILASRQDIFLLC